jgi:hypothetical protein
MAVSWDDDYDEIHDTWMRRIYWVWACKPPWWRPIKRYRWARLKEYVDAPLDRLYEPHYPTHS